MTDITRRVNMREISYFYTSPDVLIDNSGLNSFSLIRSIIEVLDYYGIKDFTAEDVYCIFKEIGIVQRSNGRVFAPSVKKISGVLECYINNKNRKYSLSLHEKTFHIESWDHTGYLYEIEYAKNSGRL